MLGHFLVLFNILSYFPTTNSSGTYLLSAVSEAPLVSNSASNCLLDVPQSPLKPETGEQVTPAREFEHVLLGSISQFDNNKISMFQVIFFFKICMEQYPPGRRIFSCVNGHYICENCKKKLQEQVGTK